MSKLTTVKMDKERHLKFGMRALVELEKELGRPITELEDGLSMEDLVILFYVGLKWEDKKLTKEKTADLMDEAIENNEEGFNYLAEVIGKAFSSALGSKGTAFPSH